VFERRRPATPGEIARLLKSLDVIDVPALIHEAEMSEVASIAQLAALHTVLAVTNPAPVAERFYTVAQLEVTWAAGDGSRDDQHRYLFQVDRITADPTYEPELLLAPTGSVRSGWWMIDGIHRAAALLTTHRRSAATSKPVPVFVLPRPVW
jgi:hypothetical protein